MRDFSHLIRLVEVYSDIAGDKKGAGYGIDALIQSCNKIGSRYFKKYPAEVILDENSAFSMPSIHQNARYIDKVFLVIKRVAQRIYELKQEQFFPIILAGDHASCAGTMHGLKLAYPNEEIGVVYIDAHADIHSPYTSMSGNMHGMPLAIACGLDNIKSKINEPSEDEIKYWEQVKDIGQGIPSIKAKNVVFCALRDYEHAEDELILHYGMKKFTSEEITYFGIKMVVEKIFKQLEHCDHIYVSFDVDSIDPVYLPGTGTPAQNGLSFEQALQLNMQLLKNEKVCCWEIAEINPCLDNTKKGTEYIFQILERVTKMLIKNY